MTDRKHHQKVFDAFFGLVQAGEYEILDTIFLHMDVEKMSIDTMLSLLSHSRPAEEYFKNRDAFFKRCWDEVVRRKRKPERLLGGLEHKTEWPFAFKILPDPPKPKSLEDIQKIEDD